MEYSFLWSNIREQFNIFLLEEFPKRLNYAREIHNVYESSPNCQRYDAAFQETILRETTKAHKRLTYINTNQKDEFIQPKRIVDVMYLTPSSIFLNRSIFNLLTRALTNWVTDLYKCDSSCTNMFLNCQCGDKKIRRILDSLSIENKEAFDDLAAEPNSNFASDFLCKKWMGSLINRVIEICTEVEGYIPTYNTLVNLHASQLLNTLMSNEIEFKVYGSSGNCELEIENQNDRLELENLCAFFNEVTEIS